ncbi:MAG: hypothetical protein K0U37_04210 [Gammaproteobacteria bacterium]|nr:hypothetical protein [Gammaproteobacteria bacterium]
MKKDFSRAPEHVQDEVVRLVLDLCDTWKEVTDKVQLLPEHKDESKKLN